MARLLFLIPFFLLVLGEVPLEAAQRKDLETLLEEVDKASQDFKTIEADVTYTRIIFLLEEEETSRGKVRYKKPKKLHLELKPPRDELDISDGEYLWVYRPEAKQVEKYRIAKEETMELNFFEFGYEGSVKKAKENYYIEMINTEEKEGLYILKLTPKESETSPQYSEIRLWIEEGFWLPTQIELYESQGEVINRIVLKNVKMNKSIPDSLFQFVVPEGVEVVEPF